MNDVRKLKIKRTKKVQLLYRMLQLLIQYKIKEVTKQVKLVCS